MKTCAVVAAIGVMATFAMSGCGGSRSTIVVNGPEFGIADSGVIQASYSATPGLVSLGAGDRLGQHIHLLDVYLAAIELMGPQAEPVVADSTNLMAWAPVGLAITEDVGPELTLGD